MIFLTECKFADRNKVVYGVPIRSTVIDFEWSTKNTAADWLSK